MLALDSAYSHLIEISILGVFSERVIYGVCKLTSICDRL